MAQDRSIFVFACADMIVGSAPVVSVAPRELIDIAYGGTSGVREAFGGAAYFRNDQTRDEFIGVWGARKASRFRRRLKELFSDLIVVEGPPPARLIVLYKSSAEETVI